MYIEPKLIQEGTVVKLLNIRAAIESHNFIESPHIDDELTLNCIANNDLLINSDMMRDLGGIVEIREIDWKYRRFFIKGNSWIYPFELIDEIVKQIPTYQPIKMSIDDVFNGLSTKKIEELRS